ncbi:MAG: recombinase RecT [Bifidobacteriaceae bacterium]|jgi:hypothetical protein|nr:recombinase RecT [Bifidobacteriaceae bacterium]
MTDDAGRAEAAENTLAAYEVAVIKTGQWLGTEVWFSVDGREWREVVPKTDEHMFPRFAKAVVRREGLTVPVVVVASWSEVVPQAREWMGLWCQRPHVMFGAYVMRAALRRAFRDVIGDGIAPDEADAPAVPDRDWPAEVAQADTEAKVRALWDEAKAARAVTVELESALRARLREVAAPKPGPRKGGGGDGRR